MKLHTLHHSIRDLLHEVEAGRSTESDAMVLAAKRIQAALGCHWVSFDLLTGEVGQRRLRRLLALHRSGALVTSPGEKSERSGRYFGALAERGFYACQDVQSDPVFAHLADDYLRPHGIRSLMSAAVPTGRTGRNWYTLTSVSDEPRRWRADEVTALRRCASAARAHAMACRPVPVADFSQGP